MISNIQILRGLAAFSVVVFHASLKVTGRVGDRVFPELTVGAFGVDLFFAISGFLMVFTTRRDVGGRGATLKFAEHRVRRVVPLYWIVTGATVLYQVVANRHSALLDDLPSHVACSLAFLPCSGQRPPIVIQGWTLNYEMAFYGLFAAALRWRHRGAVSVLALGLTAVALGASTGALVGASYGSNGLLFEFVAGMAAGRLFAGCREPRRFRGAACVVLVAACVAVGLGMLAYPRWFAWRGAVWGFPAAAIVGAAAFLEPGANGGGGAVAIPFRRALEQLGDASYSLYLTHVLVFRIVSRVALPLLSSGAAGAWLYATLGTVAAVWVSLVVHRRVEAPVAAALRSSSARSAPRLHLDAPRR